MEENELEERPEPDGYIKLKRIQELEGKIGKKSTRKQEVEQQRQLEIFL